MTADFPAMLSCCPVFFLRKSGSCSRVNANIYLVTHKGEGQSQSYKFCFIWNNTPNLIEECFCLNLGVIAGFNSLNVYCILYFSDRSELARLVRKLHEQPPPPSFSLNHSVSFLLFIVCLTLLTRALSLILLCCFWALVQSKTSRRVWMANAGDSN